MIKIIPEERQVLCDGCGDEIKTLGHTTGSIAIPSNLDKVGAIHDTHKFDLCPACTTKTLKTIGLGR